MPGAQDVRDHAASGASHRSHPSPAGGSRGYGVSLVLRVGGPQRAPSGGRAPGETGPCTPHGAAHLAVTWLGLDPDTHWVPAGSAYLTSPATSVRTGLPKIGR